MKKVWIVFKDDALEVVFTSMQAAQDYVEQEAANACWISKDISPPILLFGNHWTIKAYNLYE